MMVNRLWEEGTGVEEEEEEKGGEISVSIEPLTHCNNSL